MRLRLGFVGTTSFSKDFYESEIRRSYKRNSSSIFSHCFRPLSKGISCTSSLLRI